MKKEENKEIVIRALSDCDAVRTRPGMYVGAVNNPDVIFREVIDGSFDESYSTGCDRIIISTDTGGYYFVSDNGRGIPITMSIDDPTKTQAFLAIGKLHAGANFNTSGIRAGMHGVGESAANFLSTEFILLSRITNDNYDKSIPAVFDIWGNSGPRIKKELYYILVFREGKLEYEGATRLTDFSKKLGVELPQDMSTLVFFKPDPTIFDSTKASIPESNIQNFLLIQDKYYGRKIKIWCDGRELSSSSFRPYAFEFIKTIIPKDTSLNEKVTMYVTFEVANDLGNKIESGSVNGLTVNQGIHLTWAENFYEEAIRTEYKIKHKCIFQGLKIHVLLLAGEVLYDSQTKTRLRSISKVKPEDLKPEIVKEFVKIFRKNSDYWGVHVEKLNMLADSMKSISAVDKAQRIIDDAAGRGLYKAKGDMVEGFADATAGPSERWDCELFLCFTGDTEIKTCNDEAIKFTDLVDRLDSGEEIYTFSCTSEGIIKPAKIIAAKKIKEVDKLCKVTLDNGESFTCTPDHKIMMRSGDYEEAGNLKSGDSLMPTTLECNKEVISVEFLEVENEPVYCLEVDTDEHNFPLACGVFVKNCEGLSAGGSLKAGRKSTKYTAVCPLRGKVKNVKDSSADQMMSNKELFTIFRVIGLGIDANNVTKDCKTPEEAMEVIKKYSRFGKIVICTDADEDFYNRS